VSTPTVITATATISVIIARTVGTIMIRKPSVNNSVRNKLKTCRIPGNLCFQSGVVFLRRFAKPEVNNGGLQGV
jgi:hypothetical protein